MVVFRLGLYNFRKLSLQKSSPIPTEARKFLELLHIRKVFQKDGGGEVDCKELRKTLLSMHPHIYTVQCTFYSTLALSTRRKPVTGEELRVAVLINLSRRIPPLIGSH
ncbi:hypothetical protein CEXT_169051 [Caerostris extrusa]|uniref:Uncharacterized protein n=1 Tax=Caerostris extrusa TaxID=172846 RepID=A0AAV4XQU1_CAEEX|nr:hypothetical protein CEXT_169051 [Caerostris extrusa]